MTTLGFGSASGLFIPLAVQPRAGAGGVTVLHRLNAASIPEFGRNNRFSEMATGQGSREMKPSINVRRADSDC